jgi:hypothetical protein
MLHEVASDRVETAASPSGKTLCESALLERLVVGRLAPTFLREVVLFMVVDSCSADHARSRARCHRAVLIGTPFDLLKPITQTHNLLLIEIRPKSGYKIHRRLALLSKDILEDLQRVATARSDFPISFEC